MTLTLIYINFPQLAAQIIFHRETAKASHELARGALAMTGSPNELCLRLFCITNGSALKPAACLMAQLQHCPAILSAHMPLH
jgi:hypothetical protein